jgi:hypothetical protein
MLYPLCLFLVYSMTFSVFFFNILYICRCYMLDLHLQSLLWGMRPVARTIKVVSKSSSATTAQDVLFISYCNMFRPIWWPSSGKSYKLFKEATIPTMDLLCFSTNLIMYVSCRTASVVRWSEFLATDPEARVRFPALPEKKFSGSRTGCTQPREYKLRSYLIKK